MPRPTTRGHFAQWLATAATWLLSIGAGISLLAGQGGGLYLLAFGMLLAIALQVAAWTLVVEAGQHTHPNEHPRAKDGSRGVPHQ